MSSVACSTALPCSASRLLLLSSVACALSQFSFDEVERKRSQLVVGLDPRPDLFPVELRGDVTRFCCGIVDAVAPHAIAVKPQLAFFEALGPAGMSAFAETCTAS